MKSQVIWAILYNEKTREVRWVYTLPDGGHLTAYQTAEAFIAQVPAVQDGIQQMFDMVKASLSRTIQAPRAETASQEIPFDVVNWEKKMGEKEGGLEC